MGNNITVFLEVFNEAHRLEACLKNFQWAEELVVFVKKSNDNTFEIAQKFATHVYEVEYCNASENFAFNVNSHLSKEWCLFITASSLIDYELSIEIEKITRDVNFGYDVVGLPYSMYVLGITGRSSPWGACYKYSLIRRSALKLSDVLHNEIGWHGNNIFTINDKSTVGRLYHCTHASMDDFFQRHLRYVKYEAKQYREMYGKRAFGIAFNGFLRSIGSVLFKTRSIWRGRDGFILSLAYVSYFLMRLIYVWHETRFSVDPYEEQRKKSVEKWSKYSNLNN
jgi:(heptosyl)LPS beta-1,4-glucosyltransferase